MWGLGSVGIRERGDWRMGGLGDDSVIRLGIENLAFTNKKKARSYKSVLSGGNKDSQVQQ